MAAITGAVALAGAGFAVLVGNEEPAPAAPATVTVPRMEDGVIVIPTAFLARAKITTAPVTKAALAPVVRVVGTVSFDPSHEAAVGTRLRGFVRKLHKLEGDSVQAGDVLAEIESADLGEAQAQVASLRAQGLAAERNAKRERDLSDKRLTTARELEVAEAELGAHKALLGAAQQRVAALGGAGSGPFGVFLLKAPIAGTVVERRVSAGQSVEEHLVAFRVVDLDHLWVELSVFEQRLRDVAKGDRVHIHPLAEPSLEIEGKIAYVGDQIDLDTRSAIVRVEIDNRARKIRPGQSVTAELFSSAPASEHITIPSSAVTFVDGKPSVFVALAPDRIVPRAVELGPADETRQAITKGLAEGDVVVTDGVFALKSELFR
ncbi:MAG: efflux RND transporter periplasmic adaptor subunit [Polyangiaceae bacterium]